MARLSRLSTRSAATPTRWAKLLAARISELSVRELDWLLADNAVHFDALETAYRGAGSGLTKRVRERIDELEDGNDGPTEPVAGDL